MIALRSNDASAPPRIVTGHLRDPDDTERLVRGVRLLRRVFATAPLDREVELEVQPGQAVADDDALRAYVHENANSLFHAVGTCAMGNGTDGRDDARSCASAASRGCESWTRR
jgi:choline dehydrogenase